MPIDNKKLEKQFEQMKSKLNTVGRKDPFKIDLSRFDKKTEAPSSRPRAENFNALASPASAPVFSNQDFHTHNYNIH